MSGVRQTWFTVVSAAAILALAAYGLYSSYDPSRGERYEEILNQYDERFGDIDTLDPDLLALIDRLYATQKNGVLGATADWLSAWIRAEPIGAVLVISLGLVAFAGLLLLPFLMWHSIRSLREIADNQRVQIRLLNRAINEAELRRQSETTTSHKPSTSDI